MIRLCWVKISPVDHSEFRVADIKGSPVHRAFEF